MRSRASFPCTRVVLDPLPLQSAGLHGHRMPLGLRPVANAATVPVCARDTPRLLETGRLGTFGAPAGRDLARLVLLPAVSHRVSNRVRVPWPRASRLSRRLHCGWARGAGLRAVGAAAFTCRLWDLQLAARAQPWNCFRNLGPARAVYLGRHCHSHDIYVRRAPSSTLKGPLVRVAFLSSSRASLGEAARGRGAQAGSCRRTHKDRRPPIVTPARRAKACTSQACGLWGQTRVAMRVSVKTRRPLLANLWARVPTG